MTLPECIDLVSMIQALWPHSKQPDEAPRLWHSFLKAHSASDAEAAVREYMATGAGFAPVVGQITSLIVDRGDTLPDADEMQAEFFRLLKRYHHDTPPQLDAFAHPLLGQFFVTNGHWREWCMAREGDGTFYAQQRDAYRALRARTGREGHNAAVGAPRTPQLPHSGRGLRRPEFVASLGEAA